MAPPLPPQDLAAPGLVMGGFADPPRDAARAFRLLLDAMARPGLIVDLGAAGLSAPIRPPAGLSLAAAAALLVLVDGATPLYLAPGHDQAPIRDWLRFHGAPPLVGPGQAAFALGDWPGLLPLDRFAQGTLEYPDRSATLIVEMPRLANRGTWLRGPGIRDRVALNLDDLDQGQGQGLLAARGPGFPRGVDLVLTAGAQLAALPRSTRLEEAAPCMSR